MNPEDPLYPIWKAVQNDPYDKGDSYTTVTSLIKPVQIQVLERRYAREIAEEQADPANLADHAFRLRGQLTHLLLERAGHPSAIQEKRFFAHVEGVKISGQGDSLVLSGETLTDYKDTNVHAVYGSGAKSRRGEWEGQLNLLRWLAAQEPYAYKVSKLYIVALFHDWRPSEAFHLKREGYPPEPMMTIPINVWPLDVARLVLLGSVRNLLRNEPLRDEALPACSPEETWEKRDEWACKKPGNKRARALHSSKSLAIEDLRPGEKVEFRPGDRIRCTGGKYRDRPYCPVARWCHQLKRWKESKG